MMQPVVGAYGNTGIQEMKMTTQDSMLRAFAAKHDLKIDRGENKGLIITRRFYDGIFHRETSLGFSAGTLAQSRPEDLLRMLRKEFGIG